MTKANDSSTSGEPDSTKHNAATESPHLAMRRAETPHPSGAVYTAALRFKKLCEDFDRLDGSQRPSKSVTLDLLDKARFKAEKNVLTTRARTSADALAQAVHGFDLLSTLRDSLPTSAGANALHDLQNAVVVRQQLGVALGAFASIAGGLEPLAGVRGEELGWGDAAGMAAALAALKG